MMFDNKEIILVCLNALLYTFCTYWAFRRRNKVILLISSIWTLCAVMGILYTLNPFRPMFFPLKPEPFIYLFVIFIITLFPFIKFNEKYTNNCTIKYNDFFLTHIFTILAFCSYLPTVEIFIKIATQGIENLSSNYANQIDARAHFSFLGKYMFSIIDYFKFITPVLIFVYYSEKKKRPLWKDIGMVLATMLPMFNNLAGGQRYLVVMLAYSLLYNYILFKGKLPIKIKRSLYKAVFLFLPLILVIFVGISISRFGEKSSYDKDFGTTYQFIRYLGESMDNFNTESWHIKNHLGGYNTFVTFYSYFMGETRDIEADNQTTGVVTNVFSTYVGNLVMDYGVLYAFIYIVLSVFFILLCLRRLKSTIGLETFIFMYLYANILLFGTTYFVYQNGFVHLVFAVFFAFLLKSFKRTASIKGVL